MQYDPYQPFQQPVSLAGSSKGDEIIDATLRRYMDIEMKLETDEEMSRRQKILLEIETIFKNWVKDCALNVLHLPLDEVENVGGQLFISGSHKLGVKEPGADIDTICVAPNFCTKELFFGSLKETFINHPKVTDFSAAEGARVPIMSFDFDRVSIDLAFAQLLDNHVPAKLDILDDAILNGVDDATVTTLNGPRVTMMIERFVGREQFPNFLVLLRVVRRWAKKRGLYGNKLGYLGGINCNLLAAFICQLYPHASPSKLIHRFFHLYGTKWKWPNPVKLNHIKANPPTAARQLDIWEPDLSGKRHLMPMVTPAYPASNSSFNVSVHTREIMLDEMRLASDIVTSILESAEQEWGRLFEPSDFFVRYSHYLCCHIVGTGTDVESTSWMGFVEARIRKLPEFLEGQRGQRLPIQHPIHLHPVKFPTQKSPNSLCYFIGFDMDAKLVARTDKNVYLSERVDQFVFSLNDPTYGYKGVKKGGLDFYVEHFTWRKGGKHLPKAVFDSLGGIENAKKVRRARVEAAKKRRDEEAAKEAEATAAAAAAEGGDSAPVEAAAAEGEAAIKTEEKEPGPRKRRRADDTANEESVEGQANPSLVLLPIRAERLSSCDAGAREPYRLPGVAWSLA